MAYQSVHTGPEVDAAVSVLSDVQDIRDQVAADKSTVTTLAGQTATNAGLAQTAATNAQADAASAMSSKNAAASSAQTAGAHAANADSARALAVVARNGAEQAEDSAWEAEGEVRYLLDESEATIDSIRAEILRQKYGAGPYPSLDIGMVGANVLDRRVTFTRASDATYRDSLGVLQTAQPNEPRFDYDPVTGESLGLLVEGPATNLLRWSERLIDSSWLKAAECYVDENAAIAPNGKMEADRVVSTGQSTVNNRLQQYISNPVSAGDAVTFSVWLRADAPVGSMLRVAGAGDADGINLSISVTTEWQRFTVTRVFEGDHNSIRVAINNSPSPHITYAWGAQLELGSTPTSYIKTEASQVTRAADNASIETSDFIYNAYEGTFIVEAEVGPADGLSHWILVAANEPDSAEGLGIAKRHEGIIAIQNRALGTADNVVLLQEITGNVKAAISYQGVNFQGCANGGPVSGRSNGPASSEWETVYIGRGRVSGINPRYLGKPIKRITYYPRRLPDAKLVELTTL